MSVISDHVIAKELDISAHTITFFAGPMLFGNLDARYEDWSITWASPPAERTYAVPALASGGAWTPVVTGITNPVTDYIWSSNAISVVTGRPQFGTCWGRHQFDPVTRAVSYVKSTSQTRFAGWQSIQTWTTQNCRGGPHSYRYDGSDPKLGTSYDETLPTSSAISFVNCFAQAAFGYDVSAKASRDDAIAWITALL